MSHGLERAVWRFYDLPNLDQGTETDFSYMQLESVRSGAGSNLHVAGQTLMKMAIVRSVSKR